MADFGICSSGEKRCGRSYQSHGLSQLLELIRVIEQRELRGGERGALLPQLDVYLITPSA
jgi:hypothetical protein